MYNSKFPTDLCTFSLKQILSVVMGGFHMQAHCDQITGDVLPEKPQ